MSRSNLNDPFGGVHALQRVLHHHGMDTTREFWLRIAVIAGGVLILSSAMVAFS